MSWPVGSCLEVSPGLYAWENPPAVCDQKQKFKTILTFTESYKELKKASFHYTQQILKSAFLIFVFLSFSIATSLALCSPSHLSVSFYHLSFICPVFIIYRVSIYPSIIYYLSIRAI